MTAMTLLLAVVTIAPQPARSDEPLRHLESVRRRAAVVYLASVLEVRRTAPLEELTQPTQGQMEAKVKLAKALRAPAGMAPPAELALRYDSRAPEPEGDGFHALRPGESVLVFADSFALAYPLELFHGSPQDLVREVTALRDRLARMDAQALRLHGLDGSSKARQQQLYDQALGALQPKRR